ncbi:Gasdermin-D [Microtus ochrogaster]|uniref:Gasdermin-D n=1 Tax=Microtus ochrogaster TaxID=79684 RepID=A0A8J6GXW3_MICOH|nr:Gasdermin-D [Microtus ochrogaster]
MEAPAMTNLGWQLDCIENQLKRKQLGTAVRVGDQIIEQHVLTSLGGTRHFSGGEDLKIRGQLAHEVVHKREEATEVRNTDFAVGSCAPNIPQVEACVLSPALVLSQGGQQGVLDLNRIMPSVFVEVVRSVLKEVYLRGELIPVDSLGNSTSFRPYSLLTKKLSSSWFWKSRYRCVNLSIKDILEPSAPEPEPECCDHFRISVVIDGNIQGRMALAGKGHGEISGAAAVSNSCNVSVNVRILRVAQNTWEVLQHERCLRQPEHRILQQLRSRGDDVFVVTEVLQTEEEVQVTQIHSKKGLGKFAVPGAFLQVEGGGQLIRKKMVTIPAGSVLAFRVTKLLIDPTWDILLFPDEKKRTFELPPSSEGPDALAPHVP